MNNYLNISDSLVAALARKQSAWNDSDVPYDEISYILRHSAISDFTRGYLYGRLDDMDLKYEEKDLFNAFYGMVIGLSLTEQ